MRWLRGKRLWAGVAALLLVIGLPVSVSRAAENVGSSDPITLTVEYRHEDTPAAGVTFFLYQAGQASDDGTLTLSGDFQQYAVSLEGLDSAGWKNLAETLFSYALRDGLAPTDQGSTNENGILQFPAHGGTLTEGLYLVAGQQHTEGGYLYTPEPFLLLLPAGTAEGESGNQILIQPKSDARPVEETAVISVLKIWQGDGEASGHPGSVTVQLLKDGAVWDTVTLSSENNWRYRWEGLSGSARYQVAEENVPDGYTVTVAQEKNRFVITNQRETVSPDTPSSETKLPQTGLLWWPVPVLTIAGLLLFLAGWLWYQQDNRQEKTGSKTRNQA